jgi:hypothetical protein
MEEIRSLIRSGLIVASLSCKTCRGESEVGQVEMPYLVRHGSLTEGLEDVGSVAATDVAWGRG